MAKYRDFVFRGEPFPVSDITGERLRREFKHSAATAASWDQWEHREWAIMPDLAAEWLARLLNLVEQGAPWPTATTWGKAFFLSKNDEPSTAPMEYRILLILSRLYRRWASMRLRDLQGWVRTWQLPEMYAGVPGGGADMAWWHLSAVNEDIFHAGGDIAGATIDIYKCFDQIVPVLGQALWHLAGMPERVLLPYRSMMANVKVVNVLPQGAGTPYRRACSIPQGCPLSMMVLAIITRPWIMLMRSMQVMPRTLADDLMLCVTSDASPESDGEEADMVDTLVLAVDATLEFIHDMGGKPSPTKSAVLASSAAHRKRLRAQKWGAQRCLIQVRHSVRDLGSHLTVSGAPTGGTLNRRADKAAVIMDRIKALPVPVERKGQLVVGKGYAMGLYGIEATPINVSALRRLQGRAASALSGRHQSMRCPEVVLARIGATGIELDATILWRRIRHMRRAWHMRPAWRPLIGRMLARIADVQDVPEVGADDDPFNAPVPFGPARLLGRRGANLLKRGPFGLLLSSVMRAGGIVQGNGGICFPGETRIDIFRDPIQWVKRAVFEAGTAAALRRVASRRPSYCHQGRIDFRLSGILNKALTKEQRSDLGSIQAGGLWTASTLFAAGLLDSPNCPWCGGAPEDLEHLWWVCPAMAEERRRALSAMQVDHRQLPNALAIHGLAPELGNCVHLAFWAGASDQNANVALGARADVGHIPEQAAAEAGIPGGVASRLTMRQLLHRIAGPFTHFVPGPVSGVSDRAPDEINCFTDGGVAFFAAGPAALPAWGGMFRGIVDEDGTGVISRSAWTEQDRDEFRFWGQLDGQALSSTRAEGWAIIGAHTIPRALHIGIDNATALRHFNSILSGDSREWSRPWGMRPDGDMWAILERIVVARGRAASRGTKVKGHATATDVLQGVVSAEVQQGNDTADRMVQRGQATFGERRRALCRLHDERTQAYGKLVGAIQAMMLAIIASTRKRREELTSTVFGGGSRPQRLVHACAPTLGDRAAARRIRPCTHTLVPNSGSGPAGWRGHVVGYLCGLEWVPWEDSHPDSRCSWLELLIDFEISTGATVREAGLLLKDSASLLRRESSIRETVTLFREEVLGQIRRCLTADVRNLFAPCRGRARFATLGVRTCTACFRAWPAWDRGRHVEVLCRVLEQRGIAIQRARAGLTAGDLVIPEGKINMARPAVWRQRHLCTDAPALTTVARDGTTAQEFPVQCSKCGGTHLLAERPSLAGSPRIYCQQCGHLVRLRRCRCMCCNNLLERCDCSQRGDGSGNRQLSIRESFFGRQPSGGAQGPTAGRNSQTSS
ncbi:hypothetical protein, partial [Limnohabitans sp.]|uniref:hypothetical protein n=1 Tax=Limnohabitans sp. TaxID=1907725 RepID=UPI003342B350